MFISPETVQGVLSPKTQQQTLYYHPEGTITDFLITIKGIGPKTILRLQIAEAIRLTQHGTQDEILGALQNCEEEVRHILLPFLWVPIFWDEGVPYADGSTTIEVTLEDPEGNPPSWDDIDYLTGIGIEIDEDTGEFEVSADRLRDLLGNDNFDWRGMWSFDPLFNKILLEVYDHRNCVPRQ